MTCLSSAALKWALNHVVREGDTDVLPVPFEFGIIKKEFGAVLPELEKIDMFAHNWAGPRRLMIPKADYAFRPACQLEPYDAILYAALIKEMGSKIEKRRMKDVDNKVFSYRFDRSRMVKCILQ